MSSDRIGPLSISPDETFGMRLMREGIERNERENRDRGMEPLFEPLFKCPVCLHSDQHHGPDGCSRCDCTASATRKTAAENGLTTDAE